MLLLFGGTDYNFMTFSAFGWKTREMKAAFHKLVLQVLETATKEDIDTLYEANREGRDQIAASVPRVRARS